MSHHTSNSGRPVVECDDPIRDPETGDLGRCGRRTYGRHHRWDDGPELGVWDLPRGWSVAPYPDDYDHGATRRSLLDGSLIEPLPWLVGVVGDVHTCPDCARRAVRTA